MGPAITDKQEQSGTGIQAPQQRRWRNNKIAKSIQEERFAKQKICRFNGIQPNVGVISRFTILDQRFMERGLNSAVCHGRECRGCSAINQGPCPKSPLRFTGRKKSDAALVLNSFKLRELQKSMICFALSSRFQSEILSRDSNQLIIPYN